MSISFNYGNFNSSYGMQQIPVVRPQDIRPEAAQETKQQSASPVQSVEPAKVQVNQASRIANLEDISLTFNKENTFDNIGTDADIAGLDMAKAISDMKRDSILSDYQTFVGPSADQLVSSMEDGVVILK